MTAADRLRLASLGLHPDRVRTLLVEWGSAGAVLRADGCGSTVANLVTKIGSQVYGMTWPDAENLN